MSRKFLYLTKMSFKKKVCSKWFVLVNVLLALVVIALFNINSIIAFFGGDFDQTIHVYVVDEGGHFDTFEKYIETYSQASNEEEEEPKISLEKVEKDVALLEEEIKEGEVIVTLEESESEFLVSSVISKEKIDSSLYQIITQSLNATKQEIGFIQMNIDPTILSQINSTVTIDRVVLNDQNSADENMEMIMGSVFPTLILPFFMLIIFLVQMIGGEICEEKTTKSMEIILSNVSAKTHLLSKIVASNLFVLLQAVLLFVYGVIGFLISTRGNGVALPSSITSVWDSLVSSGFIDSFLTLIPLALVLMILSFLAYSLVAGILASMTTNVEDFSQLQTPLMLILLASYYLALMAGMFEGSSFIRILSYVPFFSCLVSPSLFIMGQIGIGDILISLIILVVFLFFLFKYGLKIYRNGVLNYSNEKVWVRFKKALKSRES